MMTWDKAYPAIVRAIDEFVIATHDEENAALSFNMEIRGSTSFDPAYSDEFATIFGGERTPADALTATGDFVQHYLIEEDRLATLTPLLRQIREAAANDETATAWFNRFDTP